jgi:hypothetical protein
VGDIKHHLSRGKVFAVSCKVFDHVASPFHNYTTRQKVDFCVNENLQVKADY